jgi:hypothetical protein
MGRTSDGTGVTATDAQVAALCEAAADGGVETDGFAAGREADGWHLSVPGTERRGLSEAAFREAAREHARYVAEWHFWARTAPDEPDRRAFLRWVERAEEYGVPERHDRLRDGVVREWGQLAVRADLSAHGRRRYAIRHADDRGRDPGGLAGYEDPHEARRLRKEDDRGRYRPLSTAPTLRRGWIFEGLAPAAAVRVVDGFYPATVANWHREREGELDVSHWRETMERQTGIYGVIETWDRGEGHEHVNWVAEACCADSQCLKRREWEYDADTDLDVDGGDGVFPCREPCSLVVSAARRWTRLEAEEERTYEFDLTPSEKAQVEAIIDAVADGRTEEIREGDTGDAANRYRARFLRAKRFADGDLCGVPTDPGGDEDGADG